MQSCFLKTLEVSEELQEVKVYDSVKVWVSRSVEVVTIGNSHLYNYVIYKKEVCAYVFIVSGMNQDF